MPSVLAPQYSQVSLALKHEPPASLPQQSSQSTSLIDPVINDGMLSRKGVLPQHSVNSSVTRPGAEI
jgi:hypothetical protein